MAEFNFGPAVVVYGPDGTQYGSPQMAERAGVTDYTMTQPVVKSAPYNPPKFDTGLFPGERGFSFGESAPRSEDNTNMAQITTDEELQTQVGTFAGAGLPAASAITQDVQTQELMGTGAGQLGTLTTPTVVTAATPTPTTIPTAPTTGLGQVAGSTNVVPGLETMGPAQAATLTPTGDYMGTVQGAVSAGSLATAATGELDVRGTVQYQLGELMSSLESGSPMPAWASPQIRKVNAMMQQRGLGASSMASAAVTTALMESGVQIASQDANKYSAIQIQNLNSKQQAALQNAATVAAMDKANLSARLQAEVTNAQAFLSIDLKNLDNQQKSDTLTYQSLVTGLFKDAAEDNARQQFNAKNELQVEEFFAELGAQVETANNNRVVSMNQFNTSEANSMNQYNTSVRDARDKFNSQMQFAVDQSNVVWRREVNTSNTALQNETNRINVQNEYNANQNALNNLWQQYRDNASWNFTKSENALGRDHDMGLNAMNFANSEGLYDKKQKDALAAGIGNWLARLF